MEESSTKKIKDLIIRISELERMLGQKQIRIELLEKMIDLAEKDLGIDVKKNFSTPVSTGSKRTKN